jgi:hypothetical protein
MSGRRAVVAALLALGLGAAALGALVPAAVSAQSSESSTGRIEGTVRNGTAGATLGDGLRMTLIELRGGEVTGSEQAAVEGGRFAFEVEPTPETTYVPLATYGGVQYLGDVVRLSAEQPTAVRDFTVYETTSETPPLRIEETVVTVIALDRANGELTLVREDLVANPSDRVYVGGEGGATLRLPVPEGTLEASGLNAEAEFGFEDGVLATTLPLRPGVTSIVTRYQVSFERAADRYRMRITAPVDAGRVTLRVPERFVRSLRPALPARVAAEQEIEGERLLVLERTAALPGHGLVADLVGLSGIRPATNPLTEPRGAVAGAGIALAVLAAAALAAGRLRGRGGEA